MDSEIIRFYCDIVLKPLEKRKKELEKQVYGHRFASFSKKEELKMISKLFSEKLRYLAKLTERCDFNN